MESFGQTIPSISTININFRTSENEPSILKELHIKPIILKVDTESNKILEHKFFYEKGAPFILLHTNLCQRPLKLLIDTGASVSILASDIVSKNIHKTNYCFSLFGNAGREVSVTTQGMVHAIFKFDNTYLGSTLHLVERKYVGTADGYLGFDLIRPA